MSSDTEAPGFAPGGLRARIDAATRHALARGALQPIATDSATVTDRGMTFPVRILARLDHKEATTRLHRAADTHVNPFLPYDRDLWVADVSATHVCLLNKFNVIDAHVLLVTRAFESQERLLTLEDFAALWRCLAEFDGLGFYNGGQAAGASQPHKHLQLVPLPLAAWGTPVPIAPLIGVLPRAGELATSPHLPYRHAFCRIDWDPDTGIAELAQHALARYRALLTAAGIRTTAAEDGERHATPYNLLVTRDWMLAVARSVGEHAGIPVNALGYADGFLVRSREQLEALQALGPLNLLRRVGLPTA